MGKLDSFFRVDNDTASSAEKVLKEAGLGFARILLEAVEDPRASVDKVRSKMNGALLVAAVIPAATVAFLLYKRTD